MKENVMNNSTIQVDWRETGKKIRELMKAYNYTISGMAEKLNVSEDCLKHYLYGTRKIPIEICKQISLMFAFLTVEEIIVYYIRCVSL